MMKRALVLVAVVATVLVVDRGAAKAQEVQVSGPLAGAPAVRHMRVYRKGRVQLQPMASFTLQDEFARTLLVGGQLNYHITDWLGIGVWGGYGLASLETGLTGEVETKGTTTDQNALSFPSRRNFAEQIARIKWVGALQATFIPLRGKLALFQKLFLDSDFYLFGGAAFVGLEERANVTDPNVCATAPAPGAGSSDPCIASQLARASRTAIAPTFGVGLSFYANDFLAVTLEWRALPFKWNTSGTDERGSGPGNEFPDGRIDDQDRIFHFNHMVSLGLAIYLPTAAKLTD